MRAFVFVFVGLVLAARAAAFDLQPERDVVARVLGARGERITLAELPPAAAGRERFRIARDGERIAIAGSSPSALLFGVNWYLKYVALLQVSSNGDRLADGALPLPSETIERTAQLPWRYALNQNTDGYTMPYWDWSRWQREIDLYALSGINAMIVERGMDSVLYATFRDVGYSDDELRAWITQPAHQNWQLMGNLCCFNGPISAALLSKRARSAQQILARLRALGITPVLPGFYGIVPADFAKKFPHAHVIEQGDWAGFTRPGWLDPRDPMFAQLAASFYRHQRELFGDNVADRAGDRPGHDDGAKPKLADIFDMEIFQEGGTSGDVPVAEGAQHVQAALETAHPGARWMMLAWQGNPRPELLAGVDRRRLFIIDIDHDKVPRDNRLVDFQGAPYLFGGIWAFGGRTTLGANIRNTTERLPRAMAANSNLIGTAVFPEGMDSNPYAFDLFNEMAWRDAPVDAAQWTVDYVRRRYGAADAHALAAWQILRTTAYSIAPDTVEFHSEREAGQESLFAAQPSLTAFQASRWSPEAMRYDAKRFAGALTELLQVAPALRSSDTYRYDLVDVARQTLSNESRRLLPQIQAAFEAKQTARFDTLTQQWLALMQLQDRLLSTQRDFMVGVWLDRVRGWASTQSEQRRLQYDARSILTTWGDRKASEGADLHDYGNKDWAGLTADYYRTRWKTYFDALAAELHSGVKAPAIDWFALGEAWNRGTQDYPTQPHGDAYALANEVANQLGIAH